MSGVAAEEEENTIKVQCCASCGIAGIDDVKLKDCSACHLVKYCGIECQKDHRPQHKNECKKRAAELRDEILFKQPESSCFGDCPICCLPLPIDQQKSSLYLCCSKRICNGCDLANQKREAEGRLEHKCPFCRKTLPSNMEEENEHWMKRLEANDPAALRQIGAKRFNEGDYKSAFHYYTKAAKLGNVAAHFHLSSMYHYGKGVEKDEKRELHHLTEAAIGGHPLARHNLGVSEWDNRPKRNNIERAVKHFIIAAKLGFDDSLAVLKELYKTGFVSKEEFAAALRGHQAAVDETKSPQREEGYAFFGI